MDMATQLEQMAAKAAGIPKVYAAICAVLADLGKEGISKDRKNAQQGYAFRGIDDVYAAVSPCLARHHLCMLPRVLARSVTEQQSKAGGILFYVVLDVEFDLVSAEDGSKHTIRAVGEAMDSGDKATNKAMSAAYKYACMQTFCIPTEGDNDADAQTHEIAQLAPVVSVEFLAKYVAAFRDRLAKRNDAAILLCHDDLQAEGLEQYQAVWHQLGSGERAAIKDAIARARDGKAAEKAKQF
jgi:ERF superfamily